AMSPAANTRVCNFLSVASATDLLNKSAPPYSVSSDFGQLQVKRHLISGIDCAIAGPAMVAAPAPPTPVALMKSRRFIGFPPLGDVCVSDRLRFEACLKHGTSPSGFP